MSGAGVDAVTGAVVTGWEHCAQSIRVVLTTAIGSRVMRRDFGSELFDLIARPMSDTVLLAVYAAVATALALWEPRFRLTRCRLDRAEPDGVVSLSVVGDYYPRGHLGDLSWVETGRTLIVPLSA